MTRYLCPRPTALPALPALDITRVDRRMAEQAEAWLDAVAAPELQKLAQETLGQDRPGLDPDELLTDVQYAERVLTLVGSSEPLKAAKSGDAPNTPTRAVGQTLKAQDTFRLDQAYQVGRLRIGRGMAVMNNQILRSGAFSGPSLDTALPVIADKTSYSIELRGVAPRADHLDVLLYAVSLVEQTPDPEHGVKVSFTSHQFLSTLGWAINSEGYARLSTVLQELKRIELRYHDRSSPKQGRIHVDNLIGSLVMPDAENETQRWTVTLPATLFRIYDLRRNAVIDLKARAAVRSDFGRWLHGFLSSQEPGRERAYDAEAVCRAGGLNSARLTDDLKYLRATMKILQEGKLVYRGKERQFEPVLAAGARIERDKETGRYLLYATRTAKAGEAGEVLTEGAGE